MFCLWWHNISIISEKCGGGGDDDDDDGDDDDDDDGDDIITLSEARSEVGWLEVWGGRAWLRCGSNGVNYQALEIFNQSVNCDPRHLSLIRGYVSFRPSSTALAGNVSMIYGKI